MSCRSPGAETAKRSRAFLRWPTGGFRSVLRSATEELVVS